MGARDIKSEGTESCDGCRIFADSGSVFCESVVSDIVGAVFDTPMLPDMVRCCLYIKSAGGEEPSRFICLFPDFGFGVFACIASFYTNERAEQTMPIGICCGKVMPDGNGALFNASMGFFRGRPVFARCLLTSCNQLAIIKKRCLVFFDLKNPIIAAIFNR